MKDLVAFQGKCKRINFHVIDFLGNNLKKIGIRYKV